VQLTP